MTVTYSNDITTAKFGTLFKILCRWKGSVLKILWRELLIYLFFFYVIHLTYMAFLNEDQQKTFEMAVKFLKPYKTILPLSFVLGFFVTIITNRWWDQYMNIPWPYGIAVYVSSTIHGYDEVGRAMRRTIMRYVCLSLTMVFRVLSLKVKARFPKMSDLIDAGLLTKSELEIIEDLEAKFPGYGKNWMPIVWAASLVNRARAEGRIRDDMAVRTLIEELNKFRGLCGNLMIFNNVNIPLAYLHVVTIAVYTYFTIALFVEQYVKTTQDDEINLDFIPILLSLQFIIYVGWLKVAETMINPFGQDDDDFEISYMIDRNIQMSYLIVDEMHESHPELLKDQFWNTMIPKRLPGRATPPEDNNEQHKEPNDVESFDLVNKGPSRVRVITFPVRSDAETPKEEQSEKQSDVHLMLLISNQDLVPRENVIDERFQNIPGVIEKQSNLVKEMERVQRGDVSGAERGSYVIGSISDSSDLDIRFHDPLSYITRSSTIQEFNRETKTIKLRKQESYGLMRKLNLDAVESDSGDEDEFYSERNSKDQKKPNDSEARGSEENIHRKPSCLKKPEEMRETSEEALGSNGREETRESESQNDVSTRKPSKVFFSNDLQR